MPSASGPLDHPREDRDDVELVIGHLPAAPRPAAFSSSSPRGGSIDDPPAAGDVDPYADRLRPAGSAPRPPPSRTTRRLAPQSPSTSVTSPDAARPPPSPPGTRPGRAGRTCPPAAARARPAGTRSSRPASASASFIVSTPSKPMIGRPWWNRASVDAQRLDGARRADVNSTAPGPKPLLGEVGLRVHDHLAADPVRPRDAADERQVVPALRARRRRARSRLVRLRGSPASPCCPRCSAVAATSVRSAAAVRPCRPITRPGRPAPRTARRRSCPRCARLVDTDRVRVVRQRPRHHLDDVARAAHCARRLRAPAAAATACR